MPPRMIDPQQFSERVLPNGITLFTHRLDSPVCFIDLIIPHGSAFCIPENNLRGGAIHFLEHALHIQSGKHKEPNSFDLELALRGCDRGGTTYTHHTRYDISAPLDQLDYAIDSLLETVYDPYFEEDPLSVERGIVQNERDRLKRFYPGRSKVHQYINTEFRYNSLVTLEQIFGTDDDLGSFTPEELADIHTRTHKTKGTIVLAVGDSDFEALAEKLSHIKTEDPLKETKTTPSRWVDPSFRYLTFDEVNHPTYTCSWLYEALPYEEAIGLRFILRYLTNSVHGVLYDEYRKKKGWTYSVDYFSDSTSLETVFGLDVVLQSKAEIESVHKTLLKLSKKSMDDQGRVENELRRGLASNVFAYQTAESIIRGARADILAGDRIRTVKEWHDAFVKMSNSDWRHQIYERLFDPATMGAIALLPPA